MDRQGIQQGIRHGFRHGAKPKGSSGLVIGRLAGIDIRVHPTFLLLVALAAIGGLGPPAEGFLWIALVFASVVFHELAHSLVARRRGVGVRDILLLPIGGVSELDRLPSGSGDQAAIAVAGPAASFLLAALAAGACAVTGGHLLPVDLLEGAVLGRLAWMNVLLGGFNLVPAFPMDGGRLYRAWLATRMPGDEATARAARLGRELAVGLGVVAALLLDLWLGVIAVFVYVTSRAEESVTVIHARLAGLSASDVMIRVFATLDANATPGAIELLRRTTAQRQVPVTLSGSYVGLVDLLQPLPPRSTAGEMVAEVPTGQPVRPGDPLAEVLERLSEAGGAGVAVVDERGAVVGLVLRADIVALLSADVAGGTANPAHAGQR